MQRVLSILLIFCPLLSCAQDTVLKLYRPFGNTAEQVRAVVTQSYNGVCLNQSKVILREDAWLCEAGGKTYDPCFTATGDQATQVICPKSPWASESILINVSNILDNSTHIPLDMSAVFPWAVELTNGEHCQAFSSEEEYDAMPIRYKCDHNNWLVGHLQKCKSMWSMLEKTSSGIRNVKLKKAWF